MVSRKGYQFRIYPNREQEIFFTKTFGCVRFLYNHMLDDKIKYYEETKKMKQTTPASYKKDHPFLKEVDSLALANAQLHLEAAFKKFFKETDIGFPKWKSKHQAKQNYTTNMVNGNIRLFSAIQNQTTYLRLPKAGNIRIHMHRIPQGILKAVTISKQQDRYIATCLFEYENKVESKEVVHVLGLDYSQKHLYVDSEGQVCDYPHFYRTSEKRLAREQRKLSKMIKGSNNYKKQRNKVAKLHAHIGQQRKDFLHKESRKIANSWDMVVVEDIDMKAMSQGLQLGKNLMDNGFGTLRNYLKYKVEDVGKRFIKIDKWYASTQICNHCGAKRKIGLNERIYQCPKCGHIEDRDINAAKNIRDEGIRLHRG